MNGDPHIIILCLVIYLKIFTENIVDFYQSVSPEKNFLENIHRKVPFWPELCLQIVVNKSRLYM